TIGKYIHPTVIDFDHLDILDYYDKDNLISILLMKLSTTFVDNEIRLLNLLVDFLNKVEYQQSEILELYGTCTFYNVWEQACQAIFRSEIELQKLFPPAIWNYNGTLYKAKGKLIPDILFSAEERFYVIDA